MNNEELQAHLEFVDGVQKAQLLVLRALLKQQPGVVDQLRNYMTYMETQEVYADLSPEQLRAMRQTLGSLLGESSSRS